VLFKDSKDHVFKLMILRNMSFHIDMNQKTEESTWVLGQMISTFVLIKKNWNLFVKQELHYENLHKEI
jgi:hypothetical protein